MRANNLGVAYMNQQKLDQALKEFEQAAALDKSNATVQLNLGIALLNLSRVAPAEEALQRAAQLDPTNPAVWFNFGLLHRNNGEADRALADFTKAAEFAPNDPNTHYFLGDLYAQQQKYAEAEREFRRAVELDPFSVSSEFGLARALQRQGKTADAKPHYERFQQLTREKLGAPISQIYGEQGPLSLARTIPGEAVVPPAIPVGFTEMGSESGLPVNADQEQMIRGFGSGICVFDINGDGLPDIVLPKYSNGVSLYLNRGKGKFENITKNSGLDVVHHGQVCGIGDYDNDGKPDIAVASPFGVWLFHNEGGGKFREVSEKAGIDRFNNGDSAFITSLTFLDYDHDGDLDLYVTREGSQVPGVNVNFSKSNVLFRNNGDGTFSDVSQKTGLAAGFPSIGALASDINNDRAIDLILASVPIPAVFFNPREGKFPSMQLWDSTHLQADGGIASLDFDKDGWMDLAVTMAQSPGLTL